MKVSNLSEVSFDQIFDCFLKAFDGYYVKMPTDKNYYIERWKAAKVNFNLSYGMFDNNKLVGFVIHGIDKRFNVNTAFNTATGVIPEYRGRRIVKSIYDFGLNDLRRNRIEKVILEVITKNDNAINAYKSIGFEIFKEYKCYAGKIGIERKMKVELNKIPIKNYNWNILPNQQFYSWDFQKESIIEGDYILYEVIYNNKTESYFVIHPEKKYLAQFELLKNEKKDKEWERLFNAIGQVLNEVKIINIDSYLVDKIKYIDSLEMDNTVNQYEMELRIID